MVKRSEMHSLFVSRYRPVDINKVPRAFEAAPEGVADLVQITRVFGVAVDGSESSIFGGGNNWFDTNKIFNAAKYPIFMIMIFRVN